MKTEHSTMSLHQLAILSIKRATEKMGTYKHSRIHEDKNNFPFDLTELDLQDELVVCSVFTDQNNFTVITTSRLFSKLNGLLKSGYIHGHESVQAGDVKGISNKVIDYATLKLANGNTLTYQYETGRAAMIIIQALQIIKRFNELTPENVENLIRVWSK